MDKVVVNLAGQAFPLLLTVDAMREMDKLMESSIEQLPTYLSPTNPDGSRDMPSTTTRTCAVLDCLLRAGESNRRLEASFHGDDDAPRRLPKLEELSHILTPGQIINIREKVFQAVVASMAREIEVDTSKNVAGGEQK